MLHGFSNNGRQIGRAMGNSSISGNGSFSARVTSYEIQHPVTHQKTQIFCQGGKYYPTAQCNPSECLGTNRQEAEKALWNSYTSSQPSSVSSGSLNYDVPTPQSNSVPTPYATNTPDAGKKPTVSGPVSTFDATYFAQYTKDYVDIPDSKLDLTELTGSAQPTPTFNIDNLDNLSEQAAIKAHISATVNAIFSELDILFNSLSDEFGRREDEHRIEKDYSTGVGQVTLIAVKTKHHGSWKGVNYNGSHYNEPEQLKRAMIKAMTPQNYWDTMFK